MRVMEPTGNCAGSPSLYTRKGPGSTAGLGRRSMPANAVPIASAELQIAKRPRKSRRRGDSSCIAPLLGELKPFHGDGMSWTTLGAERAADAAVFVLDDCRPVRQGSTHFEERIDLLAWR